MPQRFKKKKPAVIVDWDKKTRIEHLIRNLSNERGFGKEKTVRDILEKFCQPNCTNPGTICFQKTDCHTNDGHKADFIITINRNQRFSYSEEKNVPAKPITFALEVKSSLKYCLEHLNEWHENHHNWAVILIVNDGAHQDLILKGLTIIFEKIMALPSINTNKTPLVLMINDKISWVKINYHNQIITGSNCRCKTIS